MWKKIGIILSAVVLVLCLGIDIWYVCVKLYGPDKVASNTFEVDLQTSADGETKKPIFEVNYFRNENGNGYEAFELKSNYFRDEDKDAFHSQGMQYVAETTSSKINFEYFVDEAQSRVRLKEFDKGGWYSAKHAYGYWGSWLPDEGCEMFNYSSADDYATTTMSTNPVGLNSLFKIELDGNMYLMKFKGLNTPMNESNYQYNKNGKYNFYAVFGNRDVGYYYSYYDFNYLSKLLYESVQTLKAGTNQYIIFEFGDLFDYYKFNGKTYEEVALKGAEEDLVKEMTTSYYVIKVNVSNDGMQNAQEDSIFKCFKGNSTFNINPDYQSGGYFTGRSVINVTLNDFTLVKVFENSYALKLSDRFLKYYTKFKDYIVLDVLIDLDKLEEMGYTYFGFADDSGLGKFKVSSVQTQRTVDGHVQKSEVNDYGN